MGPKQFCTMLTLVGWGLKCHEPCISDHVMKFLITNVAGAGNDCLESMEGCFGRRMFKFYDDCSYVKGNTTGGQFTGKVLRKIISPNSLSLLHTYLGDTADLYINYLHSLRELYVVCTQSHMDEDYSYEEKVRKFQQSFDAVHMRFGLSETPKVHVLYSHVKDFISKCGHTMAMFSDEPIETCHGRLRFMERRHNYRCRSLVGKYKSQRSKASFDMWNRKSLYSIDKKKWKIRRYW